MIIGFAVICDDAKPAQTRYGSRLSQFALAKGGKVLADGNKLQGQFFEPTVVSEATANMLCAKEETVGPFAPVFRFKSEQEAVEAANSTEFGLGHEGSHHGMDDYVEIKRASTCA